MKKTLLNVLRGITLVGIGFVAGVALMEHISKKLESKDEDECLNCDDCCEPYDWESEWPEDFDVDESDEDIL